MRGRDDVAGPAVPTSCSDPVKEHYRRDPTTNARPSLAQLSLPDNECNRRLLQRLAAWDEELTRRTEEIQSGRVTGEPAESLAILRYRNLRGQGRNPFRHKPGSKVESKGRSRGETKPRPR